MGRITNQITPKVTLCSSCNNKEFLKYCFNCKEKTLKNMKEKEILGFFTNLFSEKIRRNENLDSNFLRSLFKKKHLQAKPSIIINKNQMNIEYNDGSWKNSTLFYFCEKCLRISECLFEYNRHIQRCSFSSVPGILGYEKGNIKIYEVDGSLEKAFCKNLCRLGKCFLGHKTLEDQVDPYLFYVLVVKNEIVGFFSREKYFLKCSLSCIVTLPCYRGKGYGYIMIDYSYKLSIAKNCPGTPEKPLSDSGEAVYKKYWKYAIYKYLSGKKFATIDEISCETGICKDDIKNTLKETGSINEKNDITIDFSEIKDIPHILEGNIFFGKYFFE